MNNLKCSVMLICLSIFSPLTFAQEKKEDKKPATTNLGAGIIAAGAVVTGLYARDEAVGLYSHGYKLQKVGLNNNLYPLTPKSLGEKLKRVQHISEVEIHYVQRTNPGWQPRVYKFQGNEKKIMEELAHFEKLNTMNKGSNVVTKLFWFEKVPTKILSKANALNAASAASISAILAGIAIYNFDAEPVKEMASIWNSPRSVVEKPTSGKKPSGKAPAGAKASRE